MDYKENLKLILKEYKTQKKKVPEGQLLGISEKGNLMAAVFYDVFQSPSSGWWGDTLTTALYRDGKINEEIVKNRSPYHPSLCDKEGCQELRIKTDNQKISVTSPGGRIYGIFDKI